MARVARSQWSSAYTHIYNCNLGVQLFLLKENHSSPNDHELLMRDKESVTLFGEGGSLKGEI